MSVEFRSKVRAPLLLLLLLLASDPWSAHAAELRIGSAQGYPGDTVDIMLSLQGDGATTSADFVIARSWVADFAGTPATVLAPGVACAREGSNFRVTWSGSANGSLVDLCVIRMKIFNSDDPRYNPAIFGSSWRCLNAADVAQPCSIARGFIDVIYEMDRSFIAVLHDPPRAPPLQDVIDFDYDDSSATPPLSFVDTIRPEHVRRMTAWTSAQYSQWLLDNPRSPLAHLHERGARFTFTTLEQREQALASARNDPAVREIVDTLGPAGPALTYPVHPRENQPFGLYLVGPSCPFIDIATPGSRSIEIVGNRIRIVLQPYFPEQVCFGVALPGYSTAVLEIPALPAGTYEVSISTPAGEVAMELVVHPAGAFASVPRQIPNPDVRLWLMLGVLVVAFRWFSKSRSGAT